VTEPINSVHSSKAQDWSRPDKRACSPIGVDVVTRADESSRAEKGLERGRSGL